MNNVNPERRQFLRVQARFTLIYDVYKPLSVSMSIGGREVDALMLDLSKGGLAITTNYDIPISTVLSMKFTLINRKADSESQIRKMEIVGEVRSSVLAENNEHRLGISFNQIKKEDAEAIEKFVQAI